MATTLRQAVKAELEGDATLLATLTGGVYDRRGINRTSTPDAYNDRGELEPCAVVVVEAATPIGPHPDYRIERVFFAVYLYEEEGNAYAGIDVAKQRIKALLHQQRVTTTPDTVWEIRHADSLGDSYDEVLKAEMSFERFFAWKKRG